MAELAAAYLVGASLCLPVMWWGWKDVDQSVRLLVMGAFLWPLWLWGALEDDDEDWG